MAILVRRDSQDHWAKKVGVEKVDFPVWGIQVYLAFAVCLVILGYRDKMGGLVIPDHLVRILEVLDK